MQAIQYRKLIVASDVSSFSSYIHKYGLGLVCKPDNVESLNATINDVVQRKDSLYENAKFEIALKDNSWEASADRHISLMHLILNVNNAQQ